MVPFFRLVLLVGCFMLSVSMDGVADDWNSFRGKSGDGLAASADYPIRWSKEENIRWKIPMPDPGNGSPIVVGEKVFFTSADADGLMRSLYCVSRKDGREIWKDSVSYAEKELTHKTNPFCPSTPVSDGRSIFVWHGSAGMHAYSIDGDKLWSQSLGAFTHIWGLGASPILANDLVIQLCGPGERTFVAAFEKSSGKIAWQTPNEPGGSDSSKGRYVGSWATPMITTSGERQQLIVCYHSRVVGLDLADGKELWSIDGLSNDRSDLCYAMPMIAGDVAVIMGGFGGPEFAFKIPSSDSSAQPTRLWRNEKSDKNGFHPQRIGSGVIVGKHLYMANADNQGSIECLEIETGKRAWVEPRTNSGPHWSSIVAVDDKLYITGQKGITRVIEANPEAYKVLAENNLDDTCNATPAFSDGQVFIRTYSTLYAIGR